MKNYKLTVLSFFLSVYILTHALVISKQINLTSEIQFRKKRRRPNKYTYSFFKFAQSTSIVVTWIF